ncbi:shikimate kinase [Oleiharenicola lentus]|uniref:shikimate kinase n=1 Tax=Oleiharenicola lentus TaxID=2508720 RepID=UPI003F67B733
MKLIFLYGPAAAGKYTVARELSALTGIELYHNHLAVDEVLKAHAFGTPEFIGLRDRMWREHFNAMAHDTIFTFNPENSVPQAFIDWLFTDLTLRGVTLYSIEVTASEQSIESRIDSKQRQQFKKLTDLGLYRKLRNAGVFLTPTIPRTELRIDTDEVQPIEAAKLIVERFKLA